MMSISVLLSRGPRQRIPMAGDSGTLRQFWLSLAALAAVAFTASLSARADDVALSVAPASVEILATPNGEGSQEVTVFNEGDHPISITAAITSYRDAGDDFSALSWLSVEPANFEIPAHSNRNVTVAIKSPSGAPTSGWYAQLAIRASTVEGTPSGAGLSGEIGASFLSRCRTVSL